jgi:hypothetical protein
MEKFKMPKYETKYCTGFWLPNDPAASHVDFMDVKIALGSWDEVEDHEDQSIFFYMDGEPLEEGLIVSDGFVIIKIAEE